MAGPQPGAAQFGTFRTCLLGALALAAGCGQARADLVINEFLPDPAGSDGGREFVELLNTGPVPVFLDGVVLQFGNGAEGAFWTNRWTGEPGTSLEPGQLFLIVDRNWLGERPGMAEVYLGLQNGPDALRLVRGESVLDLVGYGPLTDQAMMETTPAPVGTGLSTARRPDGHDSGDNGGDFVLADPTPGVRNFHPHALVVAAWELDPPSTDRVGVPVRFSAVLLNEGTEPFPVSEIVLSVGEGSISSLLDHTPPDAERVLTWNLVPETEGLLPLVVSIPLPGDGGTLDLVPGSLQVGPGPLVLNEVLGAPGHGQEEWLELAAVGPEAVNLADFKVRDEDGNWHPLPAVDLDPGELAVLAQDSVALADWHASNLVHGLVLDCDVTESLEHLRGLPGWPSLNNAAPEGRDFADRLYLSNSSGDVIDHVTIDTGGEPGNSLERLAVKPRNPTASNWAVSTAGPGSTPGCPNSVGSRLQPTFGMTVEPRVLDPRAGATTLHFQFNLNPGLQGWTLRVFDLWGVEVRDLGGDELGPGTRDYPWDGTDDSGRPAPSGGYVAVLRVHGPGGETRAVHKALLVVR